MDKKLKTNKKTCKECENYKYLALWGGGNVYICTSRKERYIETFPYIPVWCPKEIERI